MDKYLVAGASASTSKPKTNYPQPKPQKVPMWKRQLRGIAGMKAQKAKG